MNTVIRKMALALAAAAGMGSAQAGVLTYQDVVFNTTWANNVLTLEIDAAQHSGDWSRATSIGALSIKEIGSFRSVKVTAAPKGVEVWKMSAQELTAKGCSGGGGGGGKTRETTSLCLTGTPVALTDNMVFTFAFTGAPDLDEPHLKVNFLDASGNKVGDLLSKTIASTPVVVAQPVTPPVATTPVTPPVTTTPVTPPVTTTPVTPPVTTTPVTPPVTTPPVTPPAATTPVTPPPVTTAPVTPPPATEPVNATPPSTAPVSGNTSGSETFPVGSVTDSPVPPPFVNNEPVVVLQPVAQPGGASEVPEPHAIALLLGGLVLMGLALRKRS